MGRRGILSRSITALVAVLLGVLAGNLAPGPRAAAGDPADEGSLPLRSVSLLPGWNLMGWTGPDGSLSAAPAMRAAFTYEAAGQRYRTYHPAAPSALNDFTALAAGEALWLWMDTATVWSQPAVLVEPRTVALQAGFNLATWTGPNRMLARDAFAALGDRLEAAYAYDPQTRRYHVYAPALPSALQDLRQVQYGDALWLRLRAPAAWSQPGALGFRCNPFPDLANAPQGEWRSLTAGGITLRYQDGSTAAAYLHAVAARVRVALAAANARLGLSDTGPLEVRLHESAAAARAATGTTFSSIAYPAQGIVEVVCGTRDDGSVADLPALTHEIAHVLSVRAHGFAPFFLAEGLAGWVDGYIGRDPLDAWLLRARTVAMPPVSAITTDAGYFAVQPLTEAFVTAALLVRYLLEERGGLAPFWQLWDRVAAGAVDAAPLEVYGRTWEQLDADARAIYRLAPANPTGA